MDDGGIYFGSTSGYKNKHLKAIVIFKVHYDQGKNDDGALMVAQDPLVSIDNKCPGGIPLLNGY